MQINTVTAVLTFSAFALRNASVNSHCTQPPPPQGYCSLGGGGGGWLQVELTDALKIQTLNSWKPL